jgi:hypothetical protein
MPVFVIIPRTSALVISIKPAREILRIKGDWLPAINAPLAGTADGIE